MAFFLTLEGLSCFFFQIFDPAFDTSFHPSVYQKHTSCASNIEKTFLSKAFPGTAQDDNALLKYPWYAMSESLKTRQMLADAFRQRIVVDTGNAYFHGDCSKHTTGGCDQTHLQQAIIRAHCFEQWLPTCGSHAFGSTVSCVFVELQSIRRVRELSL
eukprot:gene15368-10988_t